MIENQNSIQNRVCACKVDKYIVNQTYAIYKEHSDLTLFVEEMNRQNIIGKRIWYEEKEHTIYITKVFPCDCGYSIIENNNSIELRCHCKYCNKITEYCPISFCKCSAEFYRPMFAPLFGEEVLIEPVETVLSGDERCTFAVRLGRKEEKKI